MKKTRKSEQTWERVLGFTPTVELKRIILEVMKKERISLAEACARFAMPDIVILNDGQKIPKGSLGPLVIIK